MAPGNRPIRQTPSKGLLVNKPAPNRRLIFNNKPQAGYPE
ncbi:VgrG protein [Metapseudomonas furukawaii]|uniref:VgrG protein n=1 Tax=Metapseudomonas furukawaii TaxID=1149133 RepID=A0AAD1C0M2_METFU|nr:VgrG protein [Pseudomonas furukawaii]BAU74645.1 VgrG protein [Pseudomonas furukawaii]